MKKRMKVAAMFAVMAMVLGVGYAAPAVEVITVFDPATYSGDVGEVVEVNGDKYLKVTPNGYDTSIAIEPVKLKGKKVFSCTMFGEKANAELDFTVRLDDTADGGPAKYIAMISTPAWEGGIPARPTMKRAGVAKGDGDWFRPSKSMICNAVNVNVQDSADGWKEQYDVTVYIGKITAF